jgi:hypothetical protein
MHQKWLSLLLRQPHMLHIACSRLLQCQQLGRTGCLLLPHIRMAAAKQALQRMQEQQQPRGQHPSTASSLMQAGAVAGRSRYAN